MRSLLGQYFSGKIRKYKNLKLLSKTQSLKNEIFTCDLIIYENVGKFTGKRLKNNLGLSWAMLNSSLANYARCASCFQLDCLTCESCQYRQIRHLTLVILDTKI